MIDGRLVGATDPRTHQRTWTPVRPIILMKAGYLTLSADSYQVTYRGSAGPRQ